MSQTQEQGQRVLHEETQQLLARSEAREQAAAEQQQQFMTSLQQTMHSGQDALREKMTSGIDHWVANLATCLGNWKKVRSRSVSNSNLRRVRYNRKRSESLVSLKVRLSR